MKKDQWFEAALNTHTQCNYEDKKHIKLHSCRKKDREILTIDPNIFPKKVHQNTSSVLS